MSGGGNGFRVSAVSGNVRKMIQSIKEIGSNHTEEEIYAMLKECGMDPNDAAQKLLLQDTFHEVKRKRERKKENVNSRETADSRWRSGPSGRVGRGGQGSFSSRYPADAGGGKHSVSATENGVKESARPTLPISGAKESKLKETASASSLTHNSLKHMPLGGNVGECTPHISSIASAKHAVVSSAVQPQSGVAGNSSVISGGGRNSEYRRPQPRSSKSSRPAAVMSSGKPSASDPVPVQSDESRPPVAIGAIKHETGSEQSHFVPSLIASAESKLNAAHESKSLSGQARMGSKPRGTGKNQHTEFSRPTSSGHGGSSSSHPSSNYGSRSQQAIGPPKGVSKEWKPKATSSSTVLVSMPSAASQQASPAAKPDDQDHAMHASINGYEEAASKVEKELEGLHIKETQHVIIPNHIHVPEAVRTGLSFGSFDAALVVDSSCVNDCIIEKCAEPTSMSYQAVEDTEVEQAVSNDDEVAAPESIDHPESSILVPENFPSSSADVPSSSVSDINNSKETSGIPQQSVEHASPAYNFAVVPTPVPGNVAAFDNSDPLARDASRVPSFIVQHSVDPASASFYAQFYRSNEADGRISSFSSPGISTVYTSNASMLSAEMSESSQEGGNPVALSTIGQASLATQAGVMASNIAVSQQAVSVFRQPPGMPMPHYAPNIIPYGHYFSPFYVPSPAIPQFLGNNAFHQQGQISTVYPGPPTGSAAGIKYPISQFKPGSNSGNPAHMGVTGSYGPYGTSPAGYNGSAATAGNSPNSEDRSGSQYKENIIFTAGQQSEGSAVWIAAPGRGISGLQANSFYNLPQGQHMAITPSQASHSPFASIYHPAQAVTAGALHPILQQSQGMPGAVDMAGAAPAGIYQQPQHATQMNWPKNY